MALDRDAVLRAGLAIADADGADALTMRRLAGELGVTPMALYNHVRDHRDLLDGVADLVARSIAEPTPDLPWRPRLRAAVTGLRAAGLAHPGAVPLLRNARTLAPALLRPMETALAALAEAGLSPPDARAAWTALVALTLGHVDYQLAGHMTGPADAEGRLDPEAFPHIAAMAGAPEFDWDAAFERALDSLLDGLAP